MTIWEQIEASDYGFELAKDFDGSCPCADFELRDDEGIFNAHSRCWRVSDNDQDLYVWGDHPRLKKLAEKLKDALDKTEWYNPYTIIYDDFNHERGEANE